MAAMLPYHTDTVDGLNFDDLYVAIVDVGEVKTIEPIAASSRT